MEIKIEENILYKLGDKRTIKKFLILPKKINGVWCWFKFIEINQTIVSIEKMAPIGYPVLTTIPIWETIG